MDFGSSYLPAEIVFNIIGSLSTIDNKNLRLVSKEFSAFASHIVFESLYISTKLKDRELFTTLSEHPVLSQLVKEVIYDSTTIVFAEGDHRFAPNRTSYTRFLNHRMNCSRSIVPNSSPPLSSSLLTPSPRVRYSKASFDRGFNRFVKDFYDQTEHAGYYGDDMTRIKDTLLRPSNFSSLLMDQKNHHDLAKFLPDDLVRLVHGLPRMPKVRHFKITDCRYSKNVKRISHVYAGYISNAMRQITSLSVSVKNQGIRGIDEVILDPRPWPSRNEREEDLDFDRSWYRGFFVLAQAASMTNMRRLDSFKVERDCRKSGISHTIFSMSERELYHTTNAFSSLTSIRLKIQTADMNGKAWHETIMRGDLVQILGAAKNLEILALRMDSVNRIPVHFRSLFGTHTWPFLREFTLAGVMLKVDGTGFLEFFKRHQYTLRSLWLEEVIIVTPEEAIVAWSLYESSSLERDQWSYWQEILRFMAVDPVALTNITFFQKNINPGCAGWVFHSCNPPAVLDFLRSGGINRPTVPCQHRARSWWFEEDR